MSASRNLACFVDVVDPRVEGWAGFGAGSASPETGRIDLSLILGALRIGGVPIANDRADVDAFLGYAGAPKGFFADVSAVGSFAALSGMPAPRLTIEGDGADPLDVPLPDARKPPLAFVEGVAGIMLSDLWFATSRRLMLRLESPNKAGRPLRLLAYQQRPGPGGAVVQVADGTVGAPLQLVELDLLTPFRPILVVLMDGDAIVACDHIPFPSLARGGLHAAETRRSVRSDTLGALVTCSTALAEALLRRQATPADEFRCASILFDPQGCSGTEPMFDADLLDWLATGLGIDVVPGAPGGAVVPETSVAALLREQIVPVAAASPPGFAIALAGDAVPTLSALVETPIPDSSAEGPRPAAFLAVLGDREDETWLVSPSLRGGEPGGASPYGRYPLLIPPAGAGYALGAAAPVAILFPKQPTRIEPSLIFPVAIDHAASPEGNTVPEVPPLSVLIAATGGAEPPLALARSAAGLIGEGGELLCTIARHQPQDAMAALLQALLPGRHRLIRETYAASPARQFRRMAVEAVHDTLVLLGGDTLLYDPRTLALLCAPLADPAIATVSCTVVQAQGRETAFGAAGYFLRSIDLQGTPSLRFGTPDVRRLMPGPYTVAAVPLVAVATRRTAVRNLPAATAHSFLPAVDEIGFGLEIGRSGGAHLVLPALGVGTTRTDLREVGVGAVIPFGSDRALLDRLMDGAVGLQKL